jgi:DNA-directed RNA polymerase subunit RPC12/RpoP
MFYDYMCKYCSNKIIDCQQSIHEKPYTKCEACGEHGLERIIYPPTVFCHVEITTVGQLAEKNSKKMGKYGLEEKVLKDKESKKGALSEARKELKKLGGMTDEQKRRYIENG